MFDYFLLTLKLAGILGAFLGLSTLPERGIANNKKRRMQQWLSLAALTVAIAAELGDNVAKKVDANEQANRFWRLTHPLGSIQINLEIRLDITEDGFGNYAKEVYKWAESEPPAVLYASRDLIPVPTQKADPEAYALFVHPVDVQVYLYKKPIDPRNPPKNATPDIEFTLPENVSRSDSGWQGGPLAKPSMYSDIDDEKTLWLKLPPMVNSPADRFSNGQIISSKDLVGAQLGVWVCLANLEFFNDEANQGKYDTIASSLEVSSLEFSLPGRKAGIRFSEGDQQVLRLTDMNKCKGYYVLLPSDPSFLDEPQRQIK